LSKWWTRPAISADRFSVAVCAPAVGFWLGGLRRIGFSSSASLTNSALCAALGIAAGIIAGRRFAKTSMLLFSPFSPFSPFGIWSGG